MMLAALIALACGAVAGIFLATRHFMRKRLPALIALLHGLGGATGFTLVLLTVVREPHFRPIRDVLYLLIATVLLGVVNLLFHIRKVRHRTSLILLHGFTAVTAASMLIRAIVVHAPNAEPSSSTAAVQPPAETSSAAAAPAASSGAREASAGSATAQSAAPTASAGAPSEKADEGFALDEGVRRALDSPIQFETKSAIVSQGSLASIVEIASALKQHPEVALIQVQGHADERGDAGQNVALTRARAAAVVNALAANGVGRERLHSAGYGARCPEDAACRRNDAPESCHATESWQRDRRVVFLVLQVGKASFRGEVACARGADLIPAEDRRYHVPQ